MSNFRVIIPARYASSRLPGKPLLEIDGKPMIMHVIERAQESAAQEIIVATDDKRIAEVVKSTAVTLCMTRTDHATGTDRLAEVVSRLGWSDDSIVVNLQGDEPQMPPTLLTQVFDALQHHPMASMATLCTPITSAAELFDANVVKVVTNAQDFASYFSRAVVPWQRDWFNQHGTPSLPEGVSYLRHLGIYAYRAGFLRRFATWSASPLEIAESLEQLRALWHGEKIHVSLADVLPPAGIDTADDLARVRAAFSADQHHRP